MKRLWVIEDGREYIDFAELFLAERFSLVSAHHWREVAALLEGEAPDALLLDLRFDRVDASELLGDEAATAERLFNGEMSRAREHLISQQGLLILARLREAGVEAPAVFVHAFAPRHLENLRRLYGAVDSVEGFDAERIAAALGERAR